MFGFNTRNVSGKSKGYKSVLGTQIVFFFFFLSTEVESQKIVNPWKIYNHWNNITFNPKGFWESSVLNLRINIIISESIWKWNSVFNSIWYRKLSQKFQYDKKYNNRRYRSKDVAITSKQLILNIIYRLEGENSWF